MALLNEEDLAENVKKFSAFTWQVKYSIGMTSEKLHGQRLLNALELRMVGCVYNKEANNTCSRGVSRTTEISEMEFFVSKVNRGVLRTFTNTIKFHRSCKSLRKNAVNSFIS